MNPSTSFSLGGLSLLLLSSLAPALRSEAAEKVTVNPPGMKLSGKVMKITASEVVIKSNGREQRLPLSLLSHKDQYTCRKSILDPKDAKAQFELGTFAEKHQLFEQAQLHWRNASALDTTYRDRVKQKLSAIKASPPSARRRSRVSQDPPPVRETD